MDRATRVFTFDPDSLRQAQEHCNEHGWDYRYMLTDVNDHEIEESLYLGDPRHAMEILLRFPEFRVDKG